MEAFSLSNIIDFITQKLQEVEKLQGKSFNQELKKLIAKGENHVSSNHVRHFRKEDGKFLGLVDPSYGKVKTKYETTQKSYQVELLMENEILKKSVCTCPVGRLICSHSVALMLFARTMLSKTDFRQEWNRPKIQESLEPTSTFMSTKNPGTPPVFSPTKNSDLCKLKPKLDPVKHFGFFWLCSPEIEPKKCISQNYFIDDILSSKEFIDARDKKRFLLENLMVGEDEILQIESETRMQSSNELWLRIRKNRLTASVFGKIIRCMYHAVTNPAYTFPKSLFKTLNQEYNLNGVKAVSYGISHESDALQMYTNMTRNQTKTSGIFLSTLGYIGASPDAIVDEERIVEVKCPYSAKDMTFQEYLVSKSCFLVQNNFVLELKKDHDYYHQIQGLLHITNRKNCDLVVWTCNWCQIIEITRESTWSSNLNLLEIFYNEVYLDKILNK